MAVGKRLRFQIFRRDNFACRYCGLAAKDGAVLEVDHMTPRSDGGRDVPTNLITACEDCNSGKSDIALESAVVEDVPQADLDAAIAARALAAEEGDEEELAEWVHDLEIASAVRWYSGFGRNLPHPLESGAWLVSFTTAVATGRKAEDILAACEAAGEARKPELAVFLPPAGADRGTSEEEADAIIAHAYLAGFTPPERVKLLWAARRDIGDRWPSERELITAAASKGRFVIEEFGRDKEALLAWLQRLPGDEGSLALVKATAEWDAACKGHRRTSAYECPDEVLEIAVSHTLGATVPHA
ncbi:HNH endonuclease [Nonomuraea sp. PA05]|uniref:HNH endonuclease n=1 Tax=Nonomuraea sp. PA05 TaxID=2604466 RepID=UPI001CA352CE|nr:HNH endonuclease [Nonomuraea sp. PA05]